MPHADCVNGQPAACRTPIGLVWNGAMRVVCTRVTGTQMTDTAFAREPDGGSGDSAPMRRGRIGAKYMANEPAGSPESGPEPAAYRSLSSEPAAMRARC